MPVLDMVLPAAVLVVAGFVAWRLWRLEQRLEARLRQIEELPAAVAGQVAAVMARPLEEKHRAMLADLHQGLGQQSDRLQSAVQHNAERLRLAMSNELGATRDALNALQLATTHELGAQRATLVQQFGELSATLQAKQDQVRTAVLTEMLAKLAEQARAEQELLQTTLRGIAQQLSERAEGMSKTVDARLEQISGKVNERLDEGFKKTNETFANVMARLATIDEAQKKIEGLSTNVVSLQELLGDKRSRGAFGEVQLEALVRNLLPPGSYDFQCQLSPDGRERVDCALLLPPPTGKVAVDAKFPLENYHRSFAADVSPMERELAQREFGRDVRRHIDAIASKYILPGVTSDGAVMFVPAEAVFAEIHAYYPELVDYAQQKRVWIVSPTTLMAVLNTARAVLKDVETRQQIHIIQVALNGLSREFERFDERMQKLATHIRQAHEDAQQVHITSQKISGQFRKIERAELDDAEPAGGLLK